VEDRSIKNLNPTSAEQKKVVARLDKISEKARQLQEYQKSTATNLPALEPRYNGKAVYMAGNPRPTEHCSGGHPLQSIPW